MRELNLQRLELATERELHARSYYEFFKTAFAQLHPGTEYMENWHAKYICDLLEAEARRVLSKADRDKDIIINVPFRTAKSMICTVIFPTWCWAVLSAQMKFISVSFSADLALQHSRQSRDLIYSAWYQRLYGHKVKIRPDVNAASHYETTEGGFRKAVGTGAMITGQGGDIVIVDDPQDPKRAISEVERAGVIEYYDQTLVSRLSNLKIGVKIIIQQRLHEQDLTGHLMDKRTGRPDAHKHIAIPAEYDKEVVTPPELAKFYDKDGLFWPSYFDRKLIDQFKRALGSLGAAGQLQQRPVPPEGNLFKRKWFEILDPTKQARDRINSPIHFILDTAYTDDQTQTNDPSGILAVYKDAKGYMIGVNFVQVWLEFPQLIAFIKEYIVLNGYTYNSLILIEPKASGKSIAQMLKAQRLESGLTLNVVEVAGEYIKDDKATRASAVSPICQAGKVKLLEGPWNDVFLGQLASFPKAAHDEAVDVLVYAMNYFVGVTNFFAAWI